MISAADYLASIYVEYNRATDAYPRPFINAHEAHSVIEEEYDEFKREVQKKPADRFAHTCQRELIQLAAMCLRAIVEVDWNAR
jgi:hypothetical protein